MADRLTDEQLAGLVEAAELILPGGNLFIGDCAQVLAALRELLRRRAAEAERRGKWRVMWHTIGETGFSTAEIKGPIPLFTSMVMGPTAAGKKAAQIAADLGLDAPEVEP